MILVIDNYDSFVYNLARYIKELGYEGCVYRNDQLTISDIIQLNPSHIVLSPGPCTPKEAGVSLEVIQTLKERVPILGVCLGHQAIGQAFGAKIVKALKPMHGKAALVWHNGEDIFNGIKSPLSVGRYHSLSVSQHHFPEDLDVCAHSQENEVMALKHKKYPIYGVQFHPESVLTECGYDLLKNFLVMN